MRRRRWVWLAFAAALATAFFLWARSGEPRREDPVRVSWRVDGRVEDDRGAPVPGARVRAVWIDLHDYAGLGDHRRTLAETVSAPDGSFSLDAGHDAVRTFLIAEAPGHAQVAVHLVDWQHAAGEYTPKLVLARAHATRKGRVVDGARPLEGVVVAYGVDLAGGGAVRTDSDGRFVIDGLPAGGEVRVGAAPDGYAPTVVIAREEVTLRIRRGHARAGVVTSGGRPVGGATVWAAEWPLRRRTTGPDGRYALHVSRPGATVYALAPGHARAEATAGDIALEPAVILTGRVVTDDGRPVHGARVVVSAMDDPPIHGRTGADGRFRIDHGRPKPGAIFGVGAEAPGYEAAETDEVPIDRPGEIDVGTLTLRAAHVVLTGLDVLRRDRYESLAGKRVGLVTNHTGRARDGAHAIDLLAAARNVELVRLFSPEHGIRGTADARVGSGRDEKTGLEIVSLYGDARRPPPEKLADLDALVFDIQDIGARFYTYITTMAFVMEEAKKADREVVVLDRPNPIGGVQVEGPVLEKELTGSFIGYFPLPTRHGMTVGELARLFNEEFGIGCRLTVVPMDGWRREMYFDETGLRWIDPSPNMPSVTAATHYPGLGALEARTGLSVGRGTEFPFHVYGAPWLDHEAMVAELVRRGLPGVGFLAVTFTPRERFGRPRYPHTHTECRGFRPLITDRTKYRPLTTVLHVLDVLHRLHPDRVRLEGAARMIGRRDIADRIRKGEDPDTIARSWDREPFLRVRQKYLLYD